MTRPSTEHVAEDIGILIRDASIDYLVAWRENLDRDIKDLQRQKGALEMELDLRARAARPEALESGTAQLVGETTLVSVGYSREWAWDQAELLALQGAKDGQGQPLLTDAEYSRLVSWEPKVDGRFFNTLRNRGGFLKEALDRCRSLKSARPTFDVKERQ